MSNRLVLSLLPRGCPDHPRFLISNQHDQVWSGTEWSLESSLGLLFATENDAARICLKLYAKRLKGKPVFRFVAPVEVEFQGETKPDLATLQTWLMRASKLTVNYKQEGLDDGTPILSIDWTELKEVEE